MDELSGNVYQHVTRNDAVKKSGQLLTEFAVRDFSVEEMPIEAIIREIFEKKKD